MSNINLLFRDHLCKSLITGCAVTVPGDSLLRFLSILLRPKFSDSPALEMTANTDGVCQSLTPLFTQHRVGDGEKMRKYYSVNIDKFSCICCYCLAQVQVQNIYIIYSYISSECRDKCRKSIHRFHNRLYNHGEVPY